jgi:N6-L-threonylcarbamoyladenine synthase
VAVFDPDRGLLAHTLYSQIRMHADYGGVMPELASRDHVRKLLPLIRETLREAGMTTRDLGGVAYTAGPGLIGALLVGASCARALAWSLEVPAIGVHHMEGHLLAPLLEADAPEPPFVALLVSSGHSMLIEVAAIGKYRLLGDTLDDAAGEAFDKTAKMMDLGYRAGRRWQSWPSRGFGPLQVLPADDGPPGSGLQLQRPQDPLLAYRAHAADPGAKADIARGFEAVVDTLAIKCRRALAATGCKRLVIAGGVGANRTLRARLAEAAAREGFKVYFPRLEFCTDNGAMIALAGALRLQAGLHDDTAIRVQPRWDLESLPAV